MKKEWNIPARMPEYGEISVFWIQLQTPEGQKILLKENCVGASKYFLILETYITYCKRIRQSAYAMYPTLAVTHADLLSRYGHTPMRLEAASVSRNRRQRYNSSFLLPVLWKKEHYIYRHPLQHALFIEDFQES